jgi:hypothetical protein
MVQLLVVALGPVLLTARPKKQSRLALKGRQKPGDSPTCRKGTVG